MALTHPHQPQPQLFDQLEAFHPSKWVGPRLAFVTGSNSDGTVDVTVLLDLQRDQKAITSSMPPAGQSGCGSNVVRAYSGVHVLREKDLRPTLECYVMRPTRGSRSTSDLARRIEDLEKSISVLIRR